ncbi:MAG: PKD domain-containing protein, partial [Flavobacteriales bacterium]
TNNSAQHYQWHFGDGTTSDNPMPMHTYDQPGTYTACLLVWAWDPLTQDTCYADHCEEVVMIPMGVATAAEMDGISAWPQPFSDQLTLHGDALIGPVRITLLDMAGRVMDDRQMVLQGTALLDYSATMPGAYVLRLQGGFGERTLRVLNF